MSRKGLSCSWIHILSSSTPYLSFFLLPGCRKESTSVQPYASRHDILSHLGLKVKMLANHELKPLKTYVKTSLSSFSWFRHMKGKSDSQKIPTDILFQKPKGSLETGKGIYWSLSQEFQIYHAQSKSCHFSYHNNSLSFVINALWIVRTALLPTLKNLRATFGLTHPMP